MTVLATEDEPRVFASLIEIERPDLPYSVQTVSRLKEQYRIAARLIGFRYMWWTLVEWRGEEDTAWVLHYVGLILERSSLPLPTG